MPRKQNYDRYSSITREFLIDEYINKGKPITLIAKESNIKCSVAHFYSYVKLMGIDVQIHHSKEDLTNKIFHKLKALKIVIDYNCPNKKKRTKWECICLNCGNIVILNAALVKKQLSCGCLEHKFEPGDKCINWRGCGKVPQTYFSSVKSGAKTRDLCFEITIQDMWELFQKQNEQCALTKLKIEFSHEPKIYKTGTKTASLDRINSNLGYTKNNIQWVHRIVNRMKGNLNQEEFINMCKVIAKEN